MTLVIFPAGHEATALPIVKANLGSDVRFLFAGSFNLDTIQDAIWVDLEPPSATGWLNLQAPDQREDQLPETWLSFHDGQSWANTTDLIAVRKATPADPTPEEMRERTAAAWKHIEYLKALPQVSAMHTEYHRRRH